MKKIFRNVVAAFAAVMLVSAFASCSDSDDGDDKKDDKKTEQQDENKGGKDQDAVAGVSGDEITFPVTAASTNAENTVLLIKYDRSAAGANELITISDAELKVLVNGTVSKTYNSISFTLDEYGSSFSGKTGQLTDKDDMKEYKTKLSIGKTVAANDTVKVQLTKGTISGAGKDKVNLGDVVVALVDIDPSAGYYKELCANENEYKSLIKVEEKKDDTKTDVKDEEKKDDAKEEEKKESEKTDELPKTLELKLVQNFYDGANHGLSLREKVSAYYPLPFTPKKDETYTIYMKGTVADDSYLKNMCIGFETDYDWANCAMVGGQDFSKEKLAAGISVDVTFNGTADGDWYFWFYDGNTDPKAPETTITLTDFSVLLK